MLIRSLLTGVMAWICAFSCVVAQATDISFIKTPYPGSKIYQNTNKAYVNDFYLLLSKPVEKNGVATVEKTQKMEGALQKVVYQHRVADSEIQIFESYKQALLKEGYILDFVCPNGCVVEKGRLQWFDLIKKYQADDNSILPISNYGYLSAHKGNVYVAALSGAGPSGEGPTSVVSVITKKALDSTGVEVNKDYVSAADIGKKLQQDGKIALYGVYFDTGKAEVKPQSARVLNEVAQFLKANPKIKLYVVGHTDDVGDYKANMDLSDKRAAAVVADLLGRSGSNAARLIAKGVGPLVPVSTNKNEAGKQLNRRVELIERLN